MRVSVVVPIYKVESFIARCIHSLLEQTLTDVEYIFVDDASPDGSIAVLRRVLADYPERSNHIKVLTHAKNKGLPAARNTGLAVAQGEYIFHCDSDDFVDSTMLEGKFNALRYSMQKRYRPKDEPFVSGSFWDNTFVEKEDILGKVLFRYFPRPKWLDS